MTFSVKVDHIDTSLLGSGGRTLSIRPKYKKNFTTPTYPYSKPDFMASVGHRAQPPSRFSNCLQTHEQHPGPGLVSGPCI